MNRAVRAIIRLVAAAFILFGGLEIGLDYLRHRLKNTEISAWHCLIGGILIALGIALFWASAWFAKRLTDDFDD